MPRSFNKQSAEKRAAFFTKLFNDTGMTKEKFESDTGINSARLKSKVHDVYHSKFEEALNYFKKTPLDYYTEIVPISENDEPKQIFKELKHTESQL